MKKTVKIIAVLVLLVLAVFCAVIITKEIIYVSKQIESWKIPEYEGTWLKQHIETLIKKTISDLLIHFVALILLVINAFFILFDFYFQGPIFDFQAKIKANYEASRERIKANREAKREIAKQKKYSKLKSKIEKMESDK